MVESFRKYLTSEGLLVAGITLISYISLYLFRLGYFYYFKIPTEFLGFELFEVISNTMILSFFIFIILLFLGVLKGYLDSILSKMHFLQKFLINDFLIMTLLVAFIEIIFFLLTTKKANFTIEILIIGFINIFFLCNQFLFPLIFVRGRSSPLFKYYIFNSFDSGASEKFYKNFVFFSKFIKFKTFFMTFIIALMSLSFIFLLGNYSAQNQISFFILKSKPECVILYSTSQRGVCALFDKKNRQVSGRFRLINYSDNSNLEYEQENIGPLSYFPYFDLIYLSTPTPTLESATIPTVTNTPWPSNSPARSTQTVLP